MPTDRYIKQRTLRQALSGERGSLTCRTVIGPLQNRGLILSREVNGCIWTSEASTFLDAKTAGFCWQNRRKLHLESADASGVHFHSFTSRESIRPRFRKALNVTKGLSLCHIIRSARPPQDPSWMHCGPAAGQRQPSAAPKSR